MALPISIILALLISYVAFFVKKRMSFLQNSILFLVMMMATRNYITIMSLQLKKIETTQDHFLFLFLLIHREIIIPLLVIIFCNVYLIFKGWKKKLIIFITVLCILQAMDTLSVYFKVEEYLKWNMLNDLFINIGYLVMGLGVTRLLLLLSAREGRKHESSL